MQPMGIIWCSIIWSPASITLHWEIGAISPPTSSMVLTITFLLLITVLGMMFPKILKTAIQNDQFAMRVRSASWVCAEAVLCHPRAAKAATFPFRAPASSAGWKAGRNSRKLRGREHGLSRWRPPRMPLFRPPRLPHFHSTT